jgi:amino acid adenylation domain-containing protein
MQNTIVEGYRLSPQQRRLFTVQHGQDLPYRSQCLFMVKGHLDLQMLRAAIGDLIERHEILRTAFIRDKKSEAVFQVIHDKGIVSLDWVSLCGLTPQKQEKEIRSSFNNILHHRFDLERASTMHAWLATLSVNEHALIFSVSALCADGMTLGGMVREVAIAYQARATGTGIDGSPLQHADLSEWQNDLLESTETVGLRKFWSHQRRAQAFGFGLPLESDKARTREFSPDCLSLQIRPNILGRVEAVTTTAGRSIESFLLASWQLLLARVTGLSEITVSALYDGRRSDEIKGALGLFARCLPLNSAIDDKVVFTDFLQRVEGGSQEASRWQEYFDWEAVYGPEPQDSPVRFLPFAFEFRKVESNYGSGDLSFSILKEYSCIDRFKIKLECVQNGDRIDTAFHYDASLLTTGAVSFLAGQYHTLLDNAAANPKSFIGRLDIVSPVERERIATELNDTRADIPTGTSLHEMFEAQVKRTPEKTAVVFEESELSYTELNALGNQLARHLKQLGVGPEVLVGICLERSIEMVVALLAVMKAGGAYVPLDPLTPLNRMAALLEEINAPVIVTRQGLIEYLPSHLGQEVYLDSDREQITSKDQHNLGSSACRDNLAYVLYTSGSTGKPKGVMVTHRGIVNYLCWSCEAYKMKEGNGSVVHSPIGFDLTVTSLWTPLISGQTVKLVREDLSVERLAEELRKRQKLSLIKITPSHLEMLGDLLKMEDGRQMVKRVVVGGEALKGDSIKEWQKAGVKIVNEYGPTETVVGCSIHEVEGNEDAHTDIPIGRPISNMRMYILDSESRLAALGVVGEIYIGGEGVARGYYKDAEQTAERFVPDNQSGRPGERLYRTGDLARLNEELEFHFVGRKDGQVKIRGYRIELGEVEAAIRSHRAVSECVAETRGTGEHKKIIGYVVRKEGAEASDKEIKEYVRGRLPDYMVPGEIIILEKMPLTANGKLDRKALPEFDGKRPDLESSFVPPRTEMESSLAEIWAKTLGIDKIGVNDHFFDLGGHSLLATQVVSRVRDLYEIEVPLAWFFSNQPTIAMLAKLIEQNQIARASTEDIEALLGDMQSLSDEEVSALLGSQIKPN